MQDNELTNLLQSVPILIPKEPSIVLERPLVDLTQYSTKFNYMP